MQMKLTITVDEEMKSALQNPDRIGSVIPVGGGLP